MSEILIDVAKTIGKYSLPFIWQELRYIFFYKDILNDLKDKVKDLEKQRNTNQVLIDAATRNGKKILVPVLGWMENVDKITRDANQLQEKADHASVGCCPNLLLLHKLGSEANAEAEKAGKLKIEGEFRIVAYDLPTEPDFTAYTKRIVILESRMSIMDKIMHALTDPNINMVGVYGLGGVGKTTLAYQVAEKATLDKSFHKVVWASITRTPDIPSIQVQIADQLDLKLEKESILVRASCLRDRIKQEKTILIILDNIWEMFDLNEVGIPLDDHKDGKVLMTSRTQEVLNEMESQSVLMTSRNQEVLNEMESQPNFRLEALDGSESWRLFQAMTGDAVQNRGLRGVATQVANTCAGLPVLIVTVSRALKGKDIRVWKDASNKLKRADNGRLDEIYHSALEFSYNGLEGNGVKELFLLCGVLGTSSFISDLLKYGIGLDFFKDVRTVEEARNRLHSMICNLKASCLLLEGDQNTEIVQMHDNVREVAVSIASRDEHVFTIQSATELVEWPAERYTQIILPWCRIHKLPEMSNNPELKLLYLNNANNDSLEIPDSFFEGVTNLKVLDLTCMNMSSLPISMSSLTKLKTLCLDRCALGGMADLASLKNIEILSLLKSSITKLPPDIGHLTSLRMLDLNSSGLELIPPNIISSLINLEEFYAGDTSIKWEAENATKQNKNATVAELSQLPHLTALSIQIQDASILPQDDSFFERLKRYKIFIGDVWTWPRIHEDSNILKIKLTGNTHLGQGMRKLLEEVEDLHLDEFTGISNGRYGLNLEGFLQLKYLCIQNNDEIRHIVNLTDFIQPHDAFPNLEVLVLHKLSQLEKICQGPFVDMSFRKLKVIKVFNCNQLKNLISSSMVGGLSQLLEIEVSKCNFMKEIVVAENLITGDSQITTMINFQQLHSLTLQCLPALVEFCSDELNSSESNPLFSSKVAFFKLETLKLSSINTKKIWDDAQLLTDSCVQNLTSLTVESCGNIKYLFFTSMVGSFSKLRFLKISNCHVMEEIVAAEHGRNGGVNLAEVQFPRLEKMIINDMKNLKTIWYQQFGSLRTLEVKNCEKLVRIFPSHMQRNFSGLETIMVTDCSSLKEIFELTADENDEKESELNAQLRMLTLLELPNLKQIWNGDAKGILSFHNLEVVRIEECPKLEYLFPLSIAMSLPQLVEILIKQARSMKEFVAKIEGVMEGTTKFVFNRLTTLIIWNLLEADRFYAGNFSLHCPSLKILNVFYCPKLELFKTKSISNPERDHDGNLNASIPQPLFIAEEVIPKLEHWTLTIKEVRMIQQAQFPGEISSKLKDIRIQFFEDEDATFPYWLLQKLPNLRTLNIDYCSFKEILLEGEKRQNKITTRLYRFQLVGVDKIQYLCKEGSQLDPVLEVVEEIYLDGCAGLIYLVPSYVTFSHLTYLRVGQCNGLLYLFSSSTARSLAKLRQVHFLECESLQEIVKEKGDDGMEQNIAFNNLIFLELKCLPKLNWFSSSSCLHWFPVLEVLVVKQCPRMKTFSVGHTSTPELRNVEADEGWFWEDNLNATIKKISA